MERMAVLVLWYWYWCTGLELVSYWSSRELQATLVHISYVRRASQDTWLGLKCTTVNVDDPPSSSTGLERVCMDRVIHGSSGGSWMVVWTV